VPGLGRSCKESRGDGAVGSSSPAGDTGDAASPAGLSSLKAIKHGEMSVLGIETGLVSFSISVRLLRYSSSETRKGSSALPGGAEQERREQSPSGESTSSTEASIKVLLYLSRRTRSEPAILLN